MENTPDAQAHGDIQNRKRKREEDEDTEGLNQDSLDTLDLIQDAVSSQKEKMLQQTMLMMEQQHNKFHVSYVFPNHRS